MAEFGYTIEENVMNGCVPLVSTFDDEQKQVVNLTDDYVFIYLLRDLGVR